MVSDGSAWDFLAVLSQLRSKGFWPSKPLVVSQCQSGGRGTSISTFTPRVCAQASGAVRAIVDAFQPGELGADAVMDILDGTASPSGKMP